MERTSQKEKSGRPQSPLAARYVCGLLALWLIGFACSDEVRFYSGAVLDYFSAGFTSFKPMFGISWLLACALVLTFSRTSAASGRASRTALFCLGAGQLNCLVLHFWFSEKFHIGLFESAYISSGREISSNQLVHIHVSKGILYILLRFLGWDELQASVDPGRAYAEVLPAWIFVVQGFLVLGAGAGLLLALSRLFWVWPQKLRLSYATMYAVSSAAAVRCVLDGGPFDWTNIALLPVLGVLLIWPSLRLRDQLKRLLALECVAFVLLWAVHLQAATPRWQGVISNSVLSLIFIIFVGLAAACYGAPQRRGSLAGLCALFLGVLAALSTNTFWSWEFRRAQLQLGVGDSVFIEDYYDRFAAIPEVGREGQYVLRKLKIGQPIRLKSIYKSLHMKIGQELLNVSGQGCDPAQNYVASGRVLALAGEVQERDFSSPVIANFMLTPCADSTQCSLRYTAEVKGCTPNSSFEVIVNRLSEFGLQQFVLIPDRGRLNTRY